MMYQYFSPAAMAVLEKYHVTLEQIMADALALHTKKFGDSTDDILLAHKCVMVGNAVTDDPEQYILDCGAFADYITGIRKISTEVLAGKATAS